MLGKSAEYWATFNKMNKYDDKIEYYKKKQQRNILLQLYFWEQGGIPKYKYEIQLLSDLNEKYKKKIEYCRIKIDKLCDYQDAYNENQLYGQYREYI